jgi:O-antigen ligase
VLSGVRLGGIDARASAVGAGLVVLAAALTSSQGGFFAPSWGWSAMIALGVAALAAVFVVDTDAGLLDVLFAGAVAALTGWIALSAFWASDEAAAIEEAQRALVYVGLVAGLLLVSRRFTAPVLVATLAGATTAVAGYALATRLFPTSIGTYDRFAGYRLAEPLGYWNGLALVAAMGIALVLAVATSTRSLPLAGLAAAALVVLGPTLYFTFSRGGLVACAIGVAAFLVVAPQRLLRAGHTTVLAVLPAVGVAICASHPALTHRFVPAAAADSAGRSVALLLVLLALLQAAVGVGLALARDLPPATLAARVLGIVAIAAVVVAAAAAVAREGGPVAAARRGYHSFLTTPPTTSDLNKRLLSLSSNGRVAAWRTAWHLYRRHELLGAGAGSFARAWASSPDATFEAQDAHTVYLETLAELGPVGLALLLVVAAIPFVALARARDGLTAGAFAAFVTYLAHAGVDWDWELTGVTALALACGASVVVAARTRGVFRPLGPALRVGAASAAVVLFAVAFVGWVGNTALQHAQTARDEGRYGAALSDASRAHQWMPWSQEPNLVEGEALLLVGDTNAAARTLRGVLRHDPQNWEAWFALSHATTGPAARRALARAKALNRVDPSVQQSSFASVRGSSG